MTAQQGAAAHWIEEYLAGRITEHELVAGFLPHTPDWEAALRTAGLERLGPAVQNVVDLIQRKAGFLLGSHGGPSPEMIEDTIAHEES